MGMRGFGRTPGTYTQREETPATELGLVAMQAAAGAVALDMVLMIPTFALLLMGRWFFIPLALILCVVTWIVLRAFGAFDNATIKLPVDIVVLIVPMVPIMIGGHFLWAAALGVVFVIWRCFLFWLKMDRPGLEFVVPDETTWRLIVTVGVLLAALLIGYETKDAAWVWIEGGLDGLGRFGTLLIEPYRYWMIPIWLVIWVAWVVRKKGIIGLVIDVVLIVTYGIAWQGGAFQSLGYGGEWTPEGLIVFLDRVKWLYIGVLGWPWMLFGLAFSVHMLAENLSPRLVTLIPADINQIRFIDRLFPGLGREPEIGVERMIYMTSKVTLRNPNRIAGEPYQEQFEIVMPAKNPDGYPKYLAALIGGARVSSPEAKKYGYTRDEFYGWYDEKTRAQYVGLKDSLINRGLAEDIGGRHGARLTEKGIKWAANEIYNITGSADLVPASAWQYLPGDNPTVDDLDSDDAPTPLP